MYIPTRRKLRLPRKTRLIAITVFTVFLFVLVDYLVRRTETWSSANGEIGLRGFGNRTRKIRNVFLAPTVDALSSHETVKVVSSAETRVYFEQKRDFDSRELRLKLAEKQTQFLQRDTGKVKFVPESHFALEQQLALPRIASEFKYFHECNVDKKRDKRFVTTDECNATVTSLNQTTSAAMAPPLTRKPVNLFRPRMYPHVRGASSGNKRMPAYTVANHNLSLVQDSLHRLVGAWSAFADREEITWWIAHGALLSYFWNARLFPWDLDLDIQMSVYELIQLAAYNGTLIDGRFLVDVNPHLVSRESIRMNTIDARVVDTETGYMIDITGLAAVLGSNTTTYYCKTPHIYNHWDLMPLHETEFEGYKVWRPRALMTLLKHEYKEEAMFRNHARTWPAREMYYFSRRFNEWRKV
ncbi:LicD family-domain-containing protein [Chytriomyces sp. MP71]|nr:LicD family-domain-containing protein [Chytriomyces sp. MP71]